MRRILCLMGDPYHGFGGIAQMNRHLLDALCASPSVDRVTSISRREPERDAAVPERLEERHVTGSPLAFGLGAMRAARALRPDLVWCGHLNLLPVAAEVARFAHAPLAVECYGIDVWKHCGRASRRALPRADLVVTISRHTRRALTAFPELDPSRVRLLHPAIDLERFTPGPRPEALVRRYGTAGARVLLTVCRLDRSEGYKGVDRVIAVLDRLPDDVVFVVAGDGNDRPRLEALAVGRGVRERVVFCGRVDEEEKIDHYRLADAFCMPSTGEGFGITFLEAAACGLPVLGGNRDGSADALLDGSLGMLVDPEDADALAGGLAELLVKPRAVPPAIERLGVPAFRENLERLLAHPRLRGEELAA